MKRKGNLGGIFAMALILVLTLVLSVGSVSAAEPTIVDSGNCGKDGSNVTWTLDSNGLLTISGEGEMAEYESKTDSTSGEEITTAPWGNQANTVVIEDGVTGIGAAAFYGCSDLTSVTMGSSVTDIWDGAFSGCTGLTGMVLPGSVTNIGDSAFEGCVGMTTIEIPENVTALGNSAFFGCDKLKEVRYNAKAAADLTVLNGAFCNVGTSAGCMKVIFGENVEKIPCNLFYGCTSLTSVEISNSVTSIGDGAFDGCTGLTSIEIPKSVTSIGDWAFDGCTGLTEIYYNAKTAECSGSTIFYNAGAAATGLKVIFGESVENIPAYLFHGCTGLNGVTIGSNVTSIGGYAFSGCTSLTEVYYNAKALECGDAVFENVGTDSDRLMFIFGENVEKIPAYLLRNCTGLNGVTIGSNVTSIGDDAFFGCTGLTSVTIGRNVTSIGGWAFCGCTGLTSVAIGSNVTSIGDCVFYGCTGLTSVEIPNSVTSIGDCAFYGCTGLISVTIPKSVTSIGSGVFSNCTGLAGVTIPESVTSIGGGAFSGCTGLTSVTIPESVASIGDSALEGCTGLTGVTMGSGVTSIGYRAFCDCTGLTSVTIPSSVTSIGYSAFYGCMGLKEIYYNTKATECGYDAFGNAGTDSGRLKVIFGENVEKIPDDIFYNCTGLASVTIGRNVTSIGAKAFYGCTNLTELYYNAKAAADLEYDSYAFGKAGTSTGGVNAFIGESVKKIPAYLLCGAGNIRSFIFTGNPPTVGSSAFRDNYAYALYPVHNSEWTKSAREACGSHLTWIGYCMEPVSSAACRIDQTAYLPNDTLNTQGLCMTLTHKDGCTMTIPYDSGLLELGSCDMSTPGAKTIDVTYRGTTAQLKIYVHERKTQTLDKKGYPESSHNYENNLDKTYTYKAAGAVSLDVTFSAQTEVETNIDYLYVNGAQYTGTELAGKTISIQGDTLTIRLVSDKGDSAYGFSIDRIVKTYIEHQYKNGVCTLCGAKDPNYKLTAPSVKPDYLISTGKPYIKWAAVAGASKYEVYRSGSKSGTYQYIGTATKLNYTDTTAKPGYYYYYKVKSVNAGGVESDASVAVSALCHCAQPVLNSAQYLSSSGKPYLSWETVSGAGKYYVYRSGTKYGTYKYIGTASKNSYSDVSASPGYTYFYKVEAVSKVRTSANSVTSTVLATTCHCARPVVKPDYLASTGKPYLKWSAVTGASKYEVYRAGSQNGTYKYIGSTTKTGYTDTNASAGYAYYYKVKAISNVKSTANSAYSTAVKATCHCAKPVVKITTSSGKPKLTWNAVAGAGKYEVYRATSKNGTYTKMFTTTNRSYTNTNARAGTTYYYKVKAISRVRSTANSSFSVVKSIRAR